MSQNLGDNADGFNDNFAYGGLSLSNNAYVELVDQTQNVPGYSGTDALYVNNLTVPAGCTPSTLRTWTFMPEPCRSAERFSTGRSISWPQVDRSPSIPRRRAS